MTLALSIAALAGSLAILAMVKRNWLTLAQTERTLAQTWWALGEPARAERHEAQARKFDRYAWPFRR